MIDTTLCDIFTTLAVLNGDAGGWSWALNLQNIDPVHRLTGIEHSALYIMRSADVVLLRAHALTIPPPLGLFMQLPNHADVLLALFWTKSRDI